MIIEKLVRSPLVCRWIVFWGALVLAGCGSEPAVDEEGESEHRLGVLTTALDAWKAGAVHELAARQPAIRFADDDLAAGCQLVAYQLAEPETEILPFESVYVTLTLKNREAQTVSRKVGYQVALFPAPAVLRSDP